MPSRPPPPPGPPPGPRRRPLDRSSVLAAALMLADAEGLAALSMRRLAQRLGVEAMSLYNHVAGKDDVLDGIADLVVAEIALAPPGTPWRPAMRQRAIAARRVLLRHPWATVLIESRLATTPARLAYPEAILGLLRDDGFSVPDAFRTFVLLDSYVYGRVLQEAHWPFDALDQPAAAAALLEGLPAADYPQLRAVMEHLVAAAGPSAALELEASFEAGLDLLLDGIARNRLTP